MYKTILQIKLYMDLSSISLYTSGPSGSARTKWADLQQICNRSVLAKTDYLQTNLSSAESVFSLLQTVSLNTLRNSETADEKQTNNRSADYLQRLQIIRVQHGEVQKPGR